MNGFSEDLPPPADRPGKLLAAALWVGLALFIGGLALLTIWWMVAPHPDTAARWNEMISRVRLVFFLTVFAGVVIGLGPAVAAVWRGRARLRQPGWFRWIVLLMAIAMPALHLYGRSRMLALRDALASENLAQLPARWNDVGTAFTIALGVMLAIVIWAFAKSRGRSLMTRRAPAEKPAPAAPDTRRSPSPRLRAGRLEQPISGSSSCP
jgi:hypothetical protein